MAWVSPTGHNDPDNKWGLEENAYDENESSFANSDSAAFGWLELTLITPISCDKIRIMAASLDVPDVRKDANLKIEIFYSDVWHEIFGGEITKEIWVEKEIGSTQIVSKAQIKWTGAFQDYGLVFEFDFNEVVGGEEKLLTATCSVTSSTTGSLTVIIESLSATSSTASSAVGNLSVVKSFSGTSSVISSVTGSITLGWVSPTGHEDPDSGWNYEEYAYDDELGTDAATSDVDPETWSTFLELTHTTLDCSRLRFYILYENPWMDEIDLDVFYSGDWHHVYQGSYEYDVWVEKSLGGAFSVTKARVRFYNRSVVVSTHIHLCEFDFFVGGEEKLLTATCSASSSTSGSLMLGKIEAMTATAATAINLPSTTLQLLYSIRANAPPATSTAGSLSVVKSFSETSSTASSVSGSITLGKVETLSGTAQTVSSTQGSLGVIKALTGTASASASAQGSLTLGKVETLSGTASVSSATQGTLSIFKILSGTSDVTSSITGSLTLGKIEALTATASAQSFVSGQLGLVRPLAGTSSAASVLTGSLISGKIEDLTATTGIASATQGSLTLGRIESLSGTASVTSTIEGILTVAGEVLLTSTCQTTSVLSGSLTVINLVKLMKKFIQLEEIEE